MSKLDDLFAHTPANPRLSVSTAFLNLRWSQSSVLVALAVAAFVGCGDKGDGASGTGVATDPLCNATDPAATTGGDHGEPYDPTTGTQLLDVEAFCRK